MYADDTSIHVSDAFCRSVEEKLQVSCVQLYKWAFCNKMDIHPEKTKYMIITTRQKYQRLPKLKQSINVNNISIRRVSDIRFLGLVVDDRLSWSVHNFIQDLFFQTLNGCLQTC